MCYLCYSSDEGKFSNVCIPTAADDSCHIDVFSLQRAYCMYLCVLDNPVS